MRRMDARDYTVAEPEDGGAGRNAARKPTPLERSVLLTVLYADLFDYALSRSELHRRLIGRQDTAERVAAAAGRLSGAYLTVIDGYVVWRGREHLVDVRKRRRAAAAALWDAAHRYARWLACVPFLRMVAASGSLAVENAESTGDVDLFCITQRRRLWLARAFIVPLSKLTRHFSGRFPRYLCPNYVIAMDALEVVDRNLFTAHEVAQAVPIWGADVFRRFADTNTWAGEFLPQYARHVPAESPGRIRRPLLVRAVERLASGALGDALDRALHTAFVMFYRRRAERTGWQWEKMAPAYARDRYTVPEGGYVGVVRRRFTSLVRNRLGDLISSEELEALFPHQEGATSTCYDWDRLFRDEYGNAAQP